MASLVAVFEKWAWILTCVFLVFASGPAMAIDSGVSQNQAMILVIGVVIFALLTAFIGLERMLGGLLILCSVFVSLVLTILFFPLSLFFVVPFWIWGCFFIPSIWRRYTYRVEYGSSTYYSTNISQTNVIQHEHHHHHEVPTHKVVYVPVPYEQRDTVSDSQSFSKLQPPLQNSLLLYGGNVLKYNEDDEDCTSDLTFRD